MTPIRIVIVEDNPADVTLIKMALDESSIPFTLTRFPDGAAAVQDLCRNRPQEVPDAILLDLNTPKMDGFEVLEHLRRTPWMESVPVAIITSSRARIDRQAAAGRNVRYVEKRAQLEEFFTSIVELVKEMLPDRQL